MTENNKGSMQRYAMLFGTYMGGFWIAKFTLFPLGLSSPFLLLIFLGLTLYVPFLGFKYTKKYREQVLGGSISFLHAWAFNLLLYAFAALLTSMAHYVYFQFIDHDYILSTYQTLLEEVSATAAPGMESYISQLKTNLELVKSLSPLDITFQLISQNIFYGSLIALPTALFAMKKAPYESSDNL